MKSGDVIEDLLCLCYRRQHTHISQAPDLSKATQLVTVLLGDAKATQLQPHQWIACPADLYRSQLSALN